MNRRELLKASGAFIAAEMSSVQAQLPSEANAGQRIERWDVLEITLNGPTEGNPFLDTWLKTTFRKGAREIVIEGFYDGNGFYKIRFMPDSPGEWGYTTKSNSAALGGKTGTFEVIAPGAGNRGRLPIRRNPGTITYSTIPQRI